MDLSCGNVVPSSTELTEYIGVEVQAVLGQAALSEQNLPKVRVHRGVAPHPQRISVHIFLCGDRTAVQTWTLNQPPSCTKLLGTLCRLDLHDHNGVM